MADLDTIKIVLRSLLISSTRQMTPGDLERDFRESEGYVCPYIALGFRNFTSFLQDIPDTVTVLSNGIVKPVSTEETVHIQQLVAHQKTKTKPKRRPVLSSNIRRGSSSSFYGSRPPVAPRFKSSQYRPYQSSQPMYSRPYQHQPSGYHSSKADQPSGYHSSKADQPSGHYSNKVDHLSGYHSSKVDQPSGSHSSKADQPSESSRHQSDPPPRTRSGYDWSPAANIEDHFERVREAKEQARREVLSSGRPETPSPTEAGWSGETFIRNWENQQTQDLRPRRIVVAAGDSTEESDDSFYERFKEDGDGNQIKKTKTTTQLHRVEEHFKPSDLINDRLKANLTSLIKSYPEGIWACQLPGKYQELFGVSLNWSELGYDSVVQMAHDLLDIFICKRVDSGDWMLFDVSVPLPAKFKQPDNADPAPVVPDVIKSNIYNIVQEYKSGVRAEQLAQLYEEHFKKSLHSEAPGFKNDESLFMSIQDTVVRLRYVRKECYIYPGEPLPKAHLPVFKVDVNTDKQSGLFPEEVFGPGEMYPPPVLPETLESGEYLELRVAEVYNPHKFWIMIREFCLELDRLMDELQDFYHDHGEKYKMPDTTLAEGQCCTAIYMNEWHRAVIKSVADTVEVFYVDYGTVTKVPRDELRFIHRDFCKLPAQAIRASMCGIQPPNGRQRFTREAIQGLLSLVSDKTLVGFVQQFDRNEPFLELFLIDTTGDTDIHLNDVLVSQNHAAFKPELLESAEQLKSASGKETEEVVPHESAPSSSVTAKPSVSNVLIPAVQSIQSSITTAPTTNQLNSLPQTYAQTPPPGFFGSGSQTLASSAFNLAAFSNYGVNPALNPLLNPALAQMNTALQLQMQQLQQQQALVAYYQNLYQQSALLAAHAVSSSTVDSGTSSPWLGAPLKQPSVSNLQMNAAASSPASSTLGIGDSCLRKSIHSSDDGASSVAVSARPGSVVKNISETSSVESSVLSESSEELVARKKKTKKKKRNDTRLSTCGSASRDHGSSAKTPNQPRLNSDLSATQSSVKYNNSISGLALSEDSYLSSDGLNDIVVEHLDELLEKCGSGETSHESSSSHRNIAPDLVQSVASINIASITNYWKVVDCDGKCLHLFNIDGKPFVSIGELAHKFFTSFSSGDSLVRVLKNKDLSIPYKKVTRQQMLSMFSALDVYCEESVKGFDLSRNKNGSVIGTFQLVPITNVPSMFISLNVKISTVKEFQRIRDEFDPYDSYWTQ